MDEEKIEKVHKGRLASLIKADVNTYIEAETQRIINRLVVAFRDSTLSQEHLWGSIGGLCALKDLRATLDSDIKRGMRVSENG